MGKLQFVPEPTEDQRRSDPERLVQLTVPSGQTLRVTLRAGDASSANEIFVRHGAAPTATAYDVAYQGGLGANLTAVVPATEPGTYYVLIRSFSGPAVDVPVEVLAELLPFAITDVRTDAGGAGRHVTATIRGARFLENAMVKLVRPGVAEYEPVNYRIVDSTRIIAAFDLSDAPFGLYDLKVINPDGEQVVAPYRFLVERALEPEVVIGIGGPRNILAGEQGTYSVTLQNISNVDAPYVFFQVGAPELGTNAMVYGLPYVRFYTNVHGGLDGEEAADVPWAELDSRVNTTGQMLAPGYVLDQPADSFTGFSFNVTTYPGMPALRDNSWEDLKRQIYAAFPAFAVQGVLDDGPKGLDDIIPGLTAIWEAQAALQEACSIEPFIPFRFHVVAAATAMTRDEFVAHATGEADGLRDAILADEQAPAPLLTLAADAATWRQMYLASLEEGGLLRPEDGLPPIRENPKVLSLMAVLAGGILVGPAGREIRSSGSLPEFFDQVRTWYGHQEGRMAEIEYWEQRQNKCGDELKVPVPALPRYEDYDLRLSQPTYFENRP